MQLFWYGVKLQRDYVFDFEVKWVCNRILVYKIEEWFKVVYFEILECYFFVFV